MTRRIAGHVRTISPVVGDRPRELCAVCGEDTSVGSVFFSDRQVIELRDGSSTFICALCDALLRAARRGRQLTDDEARQIVENGSVIGLGWRP